MSANEYVQGADDVAVAIDDPEELSQTTRIREILSRRADVLEARNRAVDEAALGGATPQQAVMHYQSRLESLILDLWTKFEDSDITAEPPEGGSWGPDGVDVSYGTNLLVYEPIDTVEIPPPPELVPDSSGRLPPGRDPPEPKTVTIAGLRWFIENDPVVSAEFEAVLLRPPGRRTATNERFIPIRTLDKGLTVAMKFINALGVDADLQEQTQTTVIDRELLEELEQWRHEHVSN